MDCCEGIIGVRDNNDDEVKLKIIFRKTTNDFAEAEAFDSKGRRFYAKKLDRDYEYYANKLEEWKHNDTRHDEVKYGFQYGVEYYGDDGENDELIIFLEGNNAWWDCTSGLVEEHCSLKSYDNDIAEAEKTIRRLKQKKEEIRKLFDGLFE